MQKNMNNRFNTDPLVLEIENVVKKGLKTILKDFINRYDLLENTHKQIMKLPSVLNEMNNQDSMTDSDSETDESELENLKVIQIENKLDTMEKKYDLIIPILSKILNKFDILNEEIKILKETQNKKEKEKEKENEKEEDLKVESTSEPKVESNTELKVESTTELKVESTVIYHITPSIVSACENENITFKITEDDVVNNEIQFCKIDEEEEEEEEQEEEEQEEEQDDEEQDKVKEEQYEEKEVKQKEEEEEQDDEEQEEEQDEEKEVKQEEQVEEEVETEEEEEEEEEETEEEEEEEQEEEQEVEEKAEEEAETSNKEEVEEEELFEIEIDDVTYCTNNEENGFIYELSEDGEVGNKVGYLKESEPFFYADEK
jgi:hypothetical protein